MKNRNQFNRIIATFFLVIFFPTLVPSSLYAANSGPAAPEASSFEPIDATDMVNLSSGDMSYVLPLLNVPSPEGGYPLALSNHAGIAMDQEASWVGLGWSLNPGAINRGVTGVPDDWKRSKIHQIIYDAGGSETTYTGGVSIGFGKGIFSVGLYGSYTENKTFGGATSYNTDGGIEATAYGSFARVGSDGWSTGFSNGSASVSVGSNGARAGYGPFSINQNFKNGDTSVGLNIGFSLGVSLSSKNGTSVSLANGGFRLSGNNYSNNGVNITTQAFNISIPIYFVNIDFGYNRQRYWTYEKDYTRYNGSLYAGDMVDLNANENIPFRNSFDSYNSLYKLNSDQQSEGDNLSFISYDNYTVSGQGISGTIKPALLQDGSLLNNVTLRNANESNIGYRTGINSSFNKNINNNLGNNDIHFYFENEVSSYFRISSGGWSNGVENNFSNIPIESISDSRSEIQSKLNINGVIEDFYDTTNKRKRTGNVIETFTNAEINASNSTIVIKPENFDRSTAPADGIGAFKITALDGKVYHYSIPVYQKEQFSISTDVNSDFNNRFFEKEQLVPYATHWLLTAITGPDYIDINSNNMVDQADYGYWTAFDYGKWTDGFNWQTPVKSNDKSKSYEWGVKEIYYLDKIKTRTHTAFFIKSERNDDVSRSFQVGSLTNPDWKEDVSRSFVKGKDGFWYFSGIYDDLLMSTQLSDADTRYYIKKSKFAKYILCNQNKSLKLDKILLVKNIDANISKNSNQDSFSQFKGQINLSENHILYGVNGGNYEEKNSGRNSSWNGNFYNKIYDAHDFAGTNIEQKAIKSVKFDYDYDLAKKSANSIDASKGRLALRKVNFLGKNNQQLIPPYKFDYVKVANNVYVNDYDSSNEDNWGFYKNAPFAWSLNKITTPIGSEINVLYESDDIDKEAVSSYRGMNGALQFTYSQVGSKLRINVENEFGVNAINFQDQFQLGNVTLDMWTAFKHDYNDFGCETRKGSVNIAGNVQVIGVSPTNVVLETDISVTTNENDGLNWLMGKVVGINNHPDMIREDKKRGEFAEPPGCTNVTDRLVIMYNLTGNKSLADKDKNGGGARVKEIAITEDGVLKNKTTYSYNMPGYSENKTDPNYKSSGITSFVPQNYFKEIKYRTEIPSPGVMYEYVTVKNYSAANELGITEEYNFEVLKPETNPNSEDLIIPNIFEIRKTQALNAGSRTVNGETYNLDYSKFDIKDKTSSIGRLKQKKVFNSKLQLLSKFQNNYKDSGPGLTEETFSTYKKISNGSFLNYRLGVTSKTKSASVAESTTITKEGYSNTTYLDNYDYITGQALETRTMSSDGKSFKTKILPAYKKYPAMGGKVDNVNNKNMLSQTAAEYSYILDKSANTWKETSVGITTWNNEWNYQDIAGIVTTPTLDKDKIWRKHKTYVWNGLKDTNGIFSGYDNLTDDSFNWTVGVGTAQNNKWKQISEVNLYDHYSMVIEAKDINSNKAATKMGDNDTKIMATGNAGYNEMYYCGAENGISSSDWLEYGVIAVRAGKNSSYFHTGKYSIGSISLGDFGAIMKANQHRVGKYKLSVWVEKTNVAKAILKVNGIAVPFINNTIVAGNWTLKTAIIDVPLGDCTVYLSSADATMVYYDDLMLRPVASAVTGYVYNEFDELTHIVGNNGLATRFEYDAAGRLSKTYIEVVDDIANGLTGGFKLQSDNQIFYKK
jgi:YD repeat-containing protein